MLLTENFGLKSYAKSISNENDTSKPSCSKTLQENANDNEILTSSEDDFSNKSWGHEYMFDRTYDELHDDIDVQNNCPSYSNLETNENTRLNRSLENKTDDKSEEDDSVQGTSRTVNTEKKRTVIIALMKQMYEQINKIEKRQINMKSNIEEIKQLLLSRSEILKHPKDLPNLPLQTHADSQHLEEKINQQETQKEYVIKRLCLAARGTSDKECAKRVMEKLMSNHVGTFYSWQGSGGKKDSFQKSIMMKTVRLAIKKLRPDVDMGKAEDSIKEWLKSRKFVKNVANIE